MDFVARHDIGNVHTKDVCPFFREHGGAFSFAFCGFKFLFGLFFFLNGGCNGLIADSHLHPMDGNFRGGGEDITGVYWLGAFIGVGLGYMGIGDDSFDIHRYIGLF